VGKSGFYSLHLHLLMRPLVFVINKSWCLNTDKYQHSRVAKQGLTHLYGVVRARDLLNLLKFLGSASSVGKTGRAGRRHTHESEDFFSSVHNRNTHNLNTLARTALGKRRHDIDFPPY
jgi:hypothetical protein